MARRFRQAAVGKVKHLTGLAAMRALNPALATPLERALRALEEKDLPAALRHFGDCAEIDPTNKAVLHFGAEAVQRAYLNLRHQDPQPPADKLRQWRDIALTITRANFEAYPTDSVACHNVGKFIQDDGDEAGSIPWYRHAIQLKRDQVETWGNLGTALYGIGEVAEAERCWGKCVAFAAENASGALAQSYIWLRRGDFARGWPAMNARWQDHTFHSTYGRDDLSGTPWTGQPLRKGHLLLVHGEQGLGDHVQFARYVPMLRERGLRIAAIETRPPLVRWFEAAMPGVPVVARDQPLPSYTHHVTLMSLPGILGVTDATCPPLAPPVARATSGAPRRIGLTWFGTVGNPNDEVRSIPHAALAPLADIPGVTWVPLQYDPSGQADLYARAWLGRQVETVSYRDVLELAEIMMGLEMVVSVDSMPLHVAGSLGVPTIALLRYACDWRWGQRDAWHHWYPHQTNLIQDRPNDWTDVIEAVRERVASGATSSDTPHPPLAALTRP